MVQTVHEWVVVVVLVGMIDDSVDGASVNGGEPSGLMDGGLVDGGRLDVGRDGGDTLGPSTPK